MSKYQFNPETKTFGTGNNSGATSNNSQSVTITQTNHVTVTSSKDGADYVDRAAQNAVRNKTQMQQNFGRYNPSGSATQFGF